MKKQNLTLLSKNLNAVLKNDLICEVTCNGRFVEVYGIINKDWALVIKTDGTLGRVKTSLLEIVGTSAKVEIYDMAA